MSGPTLREIIAGELVVMGGVVNPLDWADAVLAGLRRHGYVVEQESQIIKMRSEIELLSSEWKSGDKWLARAKGS